MERTVLMSIFLLTYLCVGRLLTLPGTEASADWENDEWQPSQEDDKLNTTPVSLISEQDKPTKGLLSPSAGRSETTTGRGHLVSDSRKLAYMRYQKMKRKSREQLLQQLLQIRETKELETLEEEEQQELKSKRHNHSHLQQLNLQAGPEEQIHRHQEPQLEQQPGGQLLDQRELTSDITRHESTAWPVRPHERQPRTEETKAPKDPTLQQELALKRIEFWRLKNQSRLTQSDPLTTDNPLTRPSVKSTSPNAPNGSQKTSPPNKDFEKENKSNFDPPKRVTSLPLFSSDSTFMQPFISPTRAFDYLTSYDSLPAPRKLPRRLLLPEPEEQSDDMRETPDVSRDEENSPTPKQVQSRETLFSPREETRDPRLEPKLDSRKAIKPLKSQITRRYPHPKPALVHTNEGEVSVFNDSTDKINSFKGYRDLKKPKSERLFRGAAGCNDNKTVSSETVTNGEKNKQVSTDAAEVSGSHILRTDDAKTTGPFLLATNGHECQTSKTTERKSRKERKRQKRLRKQQRKRQQRIRKRKLKQKMGLQIFEDNTSLEGKGLSSTSNPSPFFLSTFPVSVPKFSFSSVSARLLSTETLSKDDKKETDSTSNIDDRREEGRDKTFSESFPSPSSRDVKKHKPIDADQMILHESEKSSENNRQHKSVNTQEAERKNGQSGSTKITRARNPSLVGITHSKKTKTEAENLSFKHEDNVSDKDSNPLTSGNILTDSDLQKKISSEETLPAAYFNNVTRSNAETFGKADTDHSDLHLDNENQERYSHGKRKFWDKRNQTSVVNSSKTFTKGYEHSLPAWKRDEIQDTSIKSDPTTVPVSSFIPKPSLALPASARSWRDYIKSRQQKPKFSKGEVDKHKPRRQGSVATLESTTRSSQVDTSTNKVISKEKGDDEKRPFVGYKTAYDFLSSQKGSRSVSVPSEARREAMELNRFMGEGMCEIFNKHFVPTNIGGKCE